MTPDNLNRTLAFNVRAPRGVDINRQAIHVIAQILFVRDSPGLKTDDRNDARHQLRMNVVSDRFGCQAA